MDFHFFEPIIIESFAHLEIDYGVDFIRVRGGGFSTATDLMCCFGEGGKQAIAEAIVLSNTTIKCPFPREAMADYGQQIPLSVTSNGIDFARSTSLLTYKGGDAADIRSLSPELGPAFGNSKVDIYGAGFQANATCWFGSVATRAKFVSNDHIQCLSSPVFIKESERVALSNISVTHRHDELDNSLNYTFYSHPSKLDIEPTHGVNTGGTKVKIGNAMLADVLRKLHALDVQVKPMCQFDTISVSATVEFEKLVYTSPPMETKSNSIKAVRVSASLNGEDFVFTQQYFHYFYPPSIHSIIPEMIWIEDATELVIHGSHFVPLDQTSCLVGDIKILAKVVSSSEINAMSN